MSQVIISLLGTLLRGTAELAVNVVLSAFLEAMMPVFDASASPWIGLIEAFIQYGVYIASAGTMARLLAETITLPALALPAGVMLAPIFMMGAWQKIVRFETYLMAGDTPTPVATENEEDE